MANNETKEVAKGLIVPMIISTIIIAGIALLGRIMTAKKS